MSIPVSQRGRLVTLITLQTADGILHQVGMVVSKERKSGHLSAVLKQGAASKRARLSPYGQSLFDSCFKKWTVTNLEDGELKCPKCENKIINSDFFIQKTKEEFGIMECASLVADFS